MEDFKKQDGQNDKDVFISRLLENYDSNIKVPSVFKDSASWYDNKWGKIAHLLNDGANHDRIKIELLFRNLNNFHEQVLHEHEISNNDISLKYIENEIIKQKHTIKKINDSAQNIDIAHKYENEIHERNKISESNIKNHELDIEKMRSFLLEKEEQKFNIAKQHQEIVKMFSEKNKIVLIKGKTLDEKIEVDKRKETNERKIKEYEMHIEKMNSFLRKIEKEERKFDRIETNNNNSEKDEIVQGDEIRNFQHNRKKAELLTVEFIAIDTIVGGLATIKDVNGNEDGELFEIELIGKGTECDVLTISTFDRGRLNITTQSARIIATIRWFDNSNDFEQINGMLQIGSVVKHSMNVETQQQQKNNEISNITLSCINQILKDIKKTSLVHYTISFKNDQSSDHYDDNG